MKYLITLSTVLILLSSCSKKKEYCWQCNFGATDTRPGLDTLICDMTEEESKTFQQNTVKMLNEEYGVAEELGYSSACYKFSNNYDEY